ncbi:SpoIIE family protein phosphatase [Leifsonia sp. NPDC080035]|uniref:SpoIIE family protein phosphatase n=1 Tax=Leifsonia sp. NPDC080035 TaxID=3143936 RepID=A0AAU7GJ64_9MICO
MVTEQRRQEALSALGILDTAPEDRFDRVTRLAQRMFGVPMVSITLIDGDRQWRKSHRGLTTEAPRESAFCDVTMRQDSALVIADARSDERFQDNPFVVGDPHLRFYAGEPLHAAGGEAVGTLCVLDTEPHEFSDEEAVMLRDLADWVQAELVRDDDAGGVTLVQTALLPRRKPAATGFEVAAACESGARVSGDFYDWYDVDGGFCVTVGDVVGGGMPAAVVATTVRAALRSATPYAGIERAIAEVSRTLEEDLGRLSLLATVLHARVSSVGDVEYLDAGHGLAFIVREAGGLERLEGGLPLGKSAERVSRTAQLAPGDALLCLSDGAFDALGGEHGLRRSEAIVRGSATPAGAVSRIVGAACAEHPLSEALAIVVRRG